MPTHFTTLDLLVLGALVCAAVMMGGLLLRPDARRPPSQDLAS